MKEEFYLYKTYLVRLPNFLILINCAMKLFESHLAVSRSRSALALSRPRAYRRSHCRCPRRRVARAPRRREARVPGLIVRYWSSSVPARAEAALKAYLGQ